MPVETRGASRFAGPLVLSLIGQSGKQEVASMIDADALDSIWQARFSIVERIENQASTKVFLSKFIQVHIECRDASKVEAYLKSQDWDFLDKLFVIWAFGYYSNALLTTLIRRARPLDDPLISWLINSRYALCTIQFDQLRHEARRLQHMERLAQGFRNSLSSEIRALSDSCLPIAKRRRDLNQEIIKHSVSDITEGPTILSAKLKSFANDWSVFKEEFDRSCVRMRKRFADDQMVRQNIRRSNQERENLKRFQEELRNSRQTPTHETQFCTHEFAGYGRSKEASPSFVDGKDDPWFWEW